MKTGADPFLMDTAPPTTPPPIIRSLPPPVPPPRLPPPRPALLTWYRVWCIVFAAVYLGVSVTELLVASGRIEPSMGLIEGAVVRDDPAAKAAVVAEKRADAPGVAAFAAMIAAFYGFAAVAARRSWAWGVGVAAISGTFLFALPAIWMAPLLIKWCQPEVKGYFRGVSPVTSR